MSLQNFKNRVIDLCIVGDVMQYRYRAGNVIDLFSVNELLYQILTTYGVCPYLADGRIKVQLQDGKTHRTYRIHDIAYACYHGQITNLSSWEHDLQTFLDWKNYNQLTVDHADNNIHNNTIYNLSLMEGTLNGSKGTIVARVRIPAYLNCAYCNGKYRVQFLQRVSHDYLPECLSRFISLDEGEGFEAAIHFLCEDAESFVQCLKYLVNSRLEWAPPLKENGVWVKTDNPCWTQEMRHSLNAQRTLAAMDEKAFQLFHCEMEASKEQ